MDMDTGDSGNVPLQSRPETAEEEIEQDECSKSIASIATVEAGSNTASRSNSATVSYDHNSERNSRETGDGSRDISAPSTRQQTQQQRRSSRCGAAAVHPTPIGLAVREAFVFRTTPDVPDGSEGQPAGTYTIDENPSYLEDSTAGLPGGLHKAQDATSLPDTETLMFRDGRRRIDMVLVYEEEELGVMTEAEMLRRERRRVFQENLLAAGLELELEGKEMAFDQKTFFLKIHIPWKALTRYAEVMNLKMPTKGLKYVARMPRSVNRVSHNRNRISHCSFLETEKEEESETPGFPFKFKKMFEYNHNRIAKEPSFYEASYSKDQEEQFVVKERELFYTSAQRSLVVWQVMMRTKYDESEKCGIRRLLNNKTYLAAFPLHEGKYAHDASSGYIFDRRLLYLEWASLSCWYKKQPFWLIKKYFGDKIGLYFAWLDFYTKMLIPAAIVGLLCFLYGAATLYSNDNVPSLEICNMSGPGNITLCPHCDKACPFTRLYQSCTFAKLTYLFDNPATVFFAIFMSFWATTFLELWKRRQAVIVWEWDLQNAEEDEEPRPEFETSVKTFRINPVTHEKEPYLPTWSKAWRLLATTSVVFLMVVVVMGTVLGTIIYRIALITVFHSSGGFFSTHAKIFTSVTAAVINLTIIMILTRLYQRIATLLTNLENPRTQTEYEDSYTFKIFVFQFVNFYSSLIYIAFFKGRFYKYPGDKEARRDAFQRLTLDVCDPAGCLSELCIQLAIIMIGKQCFNNFLEIFLPKLRNWWRKRYHISNTKDLERSYTRWEEDYHLEDSGRLALFEEYLEMVIQYGFVTLFVAAFPLAPLFALLNNIGEIRLDAYKMLTQARRPLAERVEDIGAWYGILQGLTYTAVVSNAFVIAYTSDFIPRMVYKFVYSPDNTLTGYIDFSLSEFNTSDFQKDMIPDDDGNPNTPPPETCQYRGYRNNATSEGPYGLSAVYWHVFAARLAFVVVFEHIVFALTGIMAYAIPDIPQEVQTQVKREKLLEKERKYEIGLKAAGSPSNFRDREDGSKLQGRLQLPPLLPPGTARESNNWWARRVSKVRDVSTSLAALNKTTT
ncbi:anoctamin-4-like [Schistocerca gregaria]|uniref:anoctamin-4-like n=1 Tax=Schistocerca gregaria TaxID=7010 RepID=UPI00211DAA3B|nr:anoctamin-4-like [Schistocerca gregaria]